MAQHEPYVPPHAIRHKSEAECPDSVRDAIKSIRQELDAVISCDVTPEFVTVVYFPREDTGTGCGCWRVAGTPAFSFDRNRGFDLIHTSKLTWSHWARDIEPRTAQNSAR